MAKPKIFIQSPTNQKKENGLQTIVTSDAPIKVSWFLTERDFENGLTLKPELDKGAPMSQFGLS